LKNFMRTRTNLAWIIIILILVHCATHSVKSPDQIALDYCQSLPYHKNVQCWENHLLQQSETNPDLMERCHAGLALAEFYTGLRRRGEANQIYDKLLRESASPECKKWAAIYRKGFIDFAPGNKAPKFQAVTSDGQIFDISRSRRKALVLFFWASWCGACKEDYLDLKYLQENFDHKLEIVGISGDNERASSESAIKTHALNWANIFDGNDFDGPINRLYSIHGYPTIVVIDQKGKVISNRIRHEPLKQLIKNMK
jgi:peroxiredoxin